MAAKTNAAAAQGLNTNCTTVLNQSPDNVFQFICKTLEAHHKVSTSLVVGIAQLFIVRTFNADDQQKWLAVKTRDWLKAQLNERGLQQAMVYRYISTGQELARLIQKRYVWGGVMNEILTADNEQKAFNVMMKCVMEHGYIPAGAKPTLDWRYDADHKARFSLDVLRVNLGLDTLAPVVPVTNAQPQPGTNAPAVVPSAPATKAAPASIVSRVSSDPDALKGISAGALAVAVEKVIGRETMAERLISLCTLPECLKLQTVLNTRMQQLAEGKDETEVDRVAAHATPTDEPATLPVNELNPAEVIAEKPTTGKREARRRGGRKAA